METSLLIPSSHFPPLVSACNIFWMSAQDYLEVFKGFTLTVCGLGMDSKRLSPGNYESDLSPGPAAGVCSS